MLSTLTRQIHALNVRPTTRAVVEPSPPPPVAQASEALAPTALRAGHLVEYSNRIPYVRGGPNEYWYAPATYHSCMLEK